MNGHIDLTADTDDSDSSDSDFGNQHVPLQPVATASSAYHAAFKSTASSQRTKAAQKARSAGRSQALRPKLAMPMVRTSSREGSADEHGVELASLYATCTFACLLKDHADSSSSGLTVRSSPSSSRSTSSGSPYPPCRYQKQSMLL